MDARMFRFATVATLALASLCLLGCDRKPPSRASASHADTTGAAQAPENPAAVPHPCPPQPAGPQVGRSDQRLNAARAKLAEWATMWSQALPGFEPDSLWRVESRRWQPGDIRPFEPLKPGTQVDPEDDLASQLLSVPSPDGHYTLDVDYYQVVVPMGDSIVVGGDPDSRCSIFDEQKHVEVILLQTGTDGGYQWGAWLSKSAFAIGGWTNADDYGQWQQGQLWLYSIPDSTMSVYATRIVSADAYAR